MKPIQENEVGTEDRPLVKSDTKKQDPSHNIGTETALIVYCKRLQEQLLVNHPVEDETNMLIMKWWVVFTRIQIQIKSHKHLPHSTFRRKFKPVSLYWL